ncbi:sugar transferase [Roseomonas sp. AR75]|uniref:sugar transferase n=1 Tax=Roseomonas sp. AR75 TaxID=2562311 RepID=UPI0010C0AB7A|nr:sugar transferase [Roseomonas sp. AR75]
MPGLDAFQSLAPEPETKRSVLLQPLMAGGGMSDRLPARSDGLERLAAAMRPALKRALDIAGAGALLLLALPAFLVIAALVRRDGGSAFYAHQRVGRGGTTFGCLKFRSMVVDADRRLAALLESDPAAREEWDATRKLKNDPRVTAVGRFLRATSLDELPQLINVLKGEMSLVGPRPVLASELAAFYGAAAQHYLSVRPGITGPWQISGRNDTSYAQRVALDVAYATRPSLLTDIKILLRTPVAVLARRGAY